LSTGADSTSPADPARRMFSPLGWGEAALDVRFLRAHQGRRLVSGQGSVATPAWVGGGGRPGPPRRRGKGPRQRRVTESQFGEFPAIPSFYGALARPDYGPSAADRHRPVFVGPAGTQSRPGWRRTCARSRGTARSYQSYMSARPTTRRRPCTTDGRCRQQPALSSQSWSLRTPGQRPKREKAAA